MQRNSQPLVWRAQGLSDTLDASNTFNGAMQSLRNLIPAPSTKKLWQCRPASLVKSTFGGFTGPIGAVSLFKVIGNFAYGMVASGLNPGFDQPFVYNLLTNAFVTITGITSSNVPTTQPTTGAWTPPTAALIGSKLIVTHPGFSGTGTNFVGVLNIASPSAPTWTTTQLTGTGAIAFTVPPIAVAQFNSRAYYIHNLISQPAVIFSDALNPTNTSNANQILTFGDAVPLTALAGLPLQNQLGGIIQALMVFKGLQNIYQVTGDPTTNNLAINALNVTTGTLAPNSIASMPKGLAFMSPDGMRMIDFQARVSDPIGLDGSGVTVPFIFAAVPSRVAAACGGNLLRVSVQNNNAAGSPWQEYWYDGARQVWSGPHTFPFALIQPFNNSFVGAPITHTNQIWQSDSVQSGTSTFIEDGQQMTWNWNTPLLPDADQITNNAITESSLDFAFAPSFGIINVSFLTEQLSVINSVNLTPLGPVSATIWGAFTWGAAPWGGTAGSFSPLQIGWQLPLIFARGMFQATGQSASNVLIGALHLRYQILRYIVNQMAAGEVA